MKHVHGQHMIYLTTFPQTNTDEFNHNPAHWQLEYCNRNGKARSDTRQGREGLYHRPDHTRTPQSGPLRQRPRYYTTIWQAPTLSLYTVTTNTISKRHQMEKHGATPDRGWEGEYHGPYHTPRSGREGKYHGPYHTRTPQSGPLRQHLTHMTNYYMTMRR